ncbi:MAG TPA: DNA-binding response regulator, partial [Cytophagales bacterium]|nr:DNA-binding response regulator [Cytophagales bacterium]
MKVLVVEDNPGLLTNVTTFLAQEGVVCEGVSTFEEGMEKVYAYEYDLLLLDIMLPDGNGLDLLREVRQKQSKLGVLVISAKDSVEDKINGL